MSEIIVTTKDELSKTIEEVLINYDRKKFNALPPKLYTINQVAKMLGKAHATIKKLVQVGQIKSTLSGLIPDSAIQEYLNQK